MFVTFHLRSIEIDVQLPLNGAPKDSDMPLIIRLFEHCPLIGPHVTDTSALMATASGIWSWLPVLAASLVVVLLRSTSMQY